MAVPATRQSSLSERMIYVFELDINQHSLVLRYLEESTPVERFVTFMPNQGHKAKDMFQSLILFLERMV